MPRHGWFEMGSYNMVCDQCGLVFKSGEMMRRWDNAWVDAKCFEIRQPQDFVRGIPDNQSVPYARPRQLTSTTYFRFTGGGHLRLVSGPNQVFNTYVESVAEISFDDWTPAGISIIWSNFQSTVGGFIFGLDPAGTLFFVYNNQPGNFIVATSTANPVVADGSSIFVKQTASISASQSVVTFYTSTDGETFSQLGAVVTGAGGVNFGVTNVPLSFGNSDTYGFPSSAGKLYNLSIGNQADADNIINFQADVGAPGSTSVQVGPYLMQTFDAIGTAEFELA